MPEVRPEGSSLAVGARECDRQIGVLPVVVWILQVEPRRVEMRDGKVL